MQNGSLKTQIQRINHKPSILVPLNGTEKAERILPYAVIIARWFNADINLLYVLRALQRLTPQNSYRRTTYPDIQYDRAINLALEYLQEVAIRIEHTRSAKVKWSIAKGSIAHMVANRASTLESSIITLTSSVMPILDRFIVKGVLKNLWSLTEVPLFVLKDNSVNTHFATYAEPKAFIVALPRLDMVEAVIPILQILIPKTSAKVVMVIKDSLENRKLHNGQNSSTFNNSIGDASINPTYTLVKNVGKTLQELQIRYNNAWIITSSSIRSRLYRAIFSSFFYTVLRHSKVPFIVIPRKQVSLSNSKQRARVYSTDPVQI